MLEINEFRCYEAKIEESDRPKSLATVYNIIKDSPLHQTHVHFIVSPPAHMYPVVSMPSVFDHYCKQSSCGNEARSYVNYAITAHFLATFKINVATFPLDKNK